MSYSCPPSVGDQQPEVIDWPRLVKLISDHRRFLLTTHVRPDGDGLGSTLAVAGILEALGKQATVVLGYDLPPNLRFLDPQRKIKRLGRDVSAAELQAIDLVMILDTSAWAQLDHIESILQTTRAKKVVLDHHVSSDDVGAEVFKDTEAEATGSLVVELADRLGVPLSAELAGLLFTAIATDTGWFRFASATSRTYQVAARLVEAGAKPDALYAELYEKESLARLHLLGRVMARTETELCGQVIWTAIEQSDFEATGALASDSEDMINMTLAVDGTKVAVIFVEQPRGGVKVSFRSRCHVDCSRLAEQFGGGGHRAAAGAMLHEPLASAQARVLDALRAVLE